MIIELLATAVIAIFLLLLICAAIAAVIVLGVAVAAFVKAYRDI